jgi:hypothetical protein
MIAAMTTVLAATTPEINPANYDRLQFFIPRCPYAWGDIAFVPGRNSWLNGGSGMAMMGVLMHESGHNMGFMHSSGSGSIDGVWSEYNENGDYMGSSDPYYEKDYKQPTNTICHGSLIQAS